MSFIFTKNNPYDLRSLWPNQYIFFLILLAFSVTSCAVIPKPEKLGDEKIKENIIANLSYWNSCKAEGIVNLSLKSFELKSNFLLRKKENQLRVDIFSGGLMGLSPSTKAQILYDDSLKVFLPEKNIVYILSANNEMNLNTDLAKVVTEALTIKRTKNKFMLISPSDIKFIFDQKFNLVIIQNDNIKISLKNYRGNLPYSLIIFQNDKEIVSLTIDNWSFGELKNEIFTLNIPPNVKVKKPNSNNLNDE
jgi:hypothetical protein